MTKRNLVFFLILMSSIISTAIILSWVLDDDPNVKEGYKVTMLVNGKQGYIYNSRGDGRYVIRYSDNLGNPKTVTMKRFEFEVVEYN